MPTTVEEYDVVIEGTSLAHSILAASLPALRILHIDARDGYGALESLLPFTLLQAAEQATATTTAASHLAATLPNGLSHVKLLASSSNETLGSARHYNIECTPRLLLAGSTLVDVLRDAGIAEYMDFRALADFFLFDTAAGKLVRVPSTKEDIFTDKTMPLLTKRRLMKFIKACATEDLEGLGSANEPVEQALLQDWRLSEPYVHAFAYSLGRSQGHQTPVKECMQQVKQHVTSLGRLGRSFPAVLGMFGTGSELCQAFCRKAAVKGATYRLSTACRQEGGKLLLTGEDVEIHAKYLVRAAGFSERLTRMRRAVVLCGNAETWLQAHCQAGEGMVVAIPPAAFGKETTWAVHAQVQGASAGVCPKGKVILFLEVGMEDAHGMVEAERLLEQAQQLVLNLRHPALQVLAGVQYCVFQEEATMASAAQDSLNTIKTQVTGTYDELVEETRRVHALITGTTETFMVPALQEEQDE